MGTDRKQKGVRYQIILSEDVVFNLAKSVPSNNIRKGIHSKSYIIYSYKSIVLRHFTTDSSNIRPGYAAIKEKQKYFNIDNGKRVHERGGAKDDIMYNITLLVILVGLVEWCRVVYALAFPSPK